MSQVMKLPEQLARELADCRPGYKVMWDDCQPLGIVEVRENRHTGEEKRWTSIHELVLVTEDGRLWHSLYEVGLTESQCNRPFEDDGEAEFALVIPVEVTHTEYRHAPAD